MYGTHYRCHSCHLTKSITERLYIEGCVTHNIQLVIHLDYIVSGVRLSNFHYEKKLRDESIMKLMSVKGFGQDTIVSSL